MIAEKQESVAVATPPGKPFSWLRIVLSLAVSLLALWIVTRNLDWQELTVALVEARPGYVALGLSVILLTILAKVWRWRMTFANEPILSWSALFWSLMLGQFVNLIIPVRVGDLARIYALDRQTKVGKARTLGTLVIEKTLDLALLVCTILVLLPVVVVPQFISDRGLTLAVAVAVGFLVLYSLAYQTGRIIRFLRQIARQLPASLEERLVHVALSGLQGLSALRNRRMTLLLLLISAVIALLSVLTPLVLFPAFQLPFGLTEAILLHLVVTIGSAPPSTPGKILVFEGLVVVTLKQFGVQDDALILSYAIIYHLVVILPQIILGSLAAAINNWSWRQQPHD